MGDLGKLIVAKGFKKLPKVQKIARSGHTGSNATLTKFVWHRLLVKFFISIKMRLKFDQKETKISELSDKKTVKCEF